jgi:hypothetical protein
VENRGYKASTNHEEKDMDLHPVELAMMKSINEGITTIGGTDIHTFKRLIARGLAAGVFGQQDDYFEVHLTPIGEYELAQQVRSA